MRKIALVLFLIFGMLVCSNTTADAKYNPSKAVIKEKIVKCALKHGVDPALALSVAKQESRFNKNARSHCGAIGVFQLMPATAKSLGVNPYYLNQNVIGGIKYLKQMKKKFGSTELALAAYNAGPGAVRKHRGIPPYRETRTYVKKIMANYRYLKRNPDPAIVKVKRQMKPKIANKTAILISKPAISSLFDLVKTKIEVASVTK